MPAAFGRLCVETNIARALLTLLQAQPPSGGCVLKPMETIHLIGGNEPAAFGRLCVETSVIIRVSDGTKPAAFGRLCVETSVIIRVSDGTKPAAFGRLCVETFGYSSHFCTMRQPPSGGCVLKHDASQGGCT